MKPITSGNQKVMNILVVGGGIAGLVFAILAERKGHRVTLVEQQKEWMPMGGGITITLNGINLLDKLGLSDGLSALTNEILHINVADQSGVHLSSLDLTDYAASYGRTVSIFRPDLHRALLGHLIATRVLNGATIAHFEQFPEYVSVSLSYGEEREFDLVVGCDGIYSSLRKQLFPEAGLKYAGYASWRFVVPFATGAESSTITEMWAPGKRFGVVPLVGDRVHCFAAINSIAGSVQNRTLSTGEFKELFSGFGGQVPRVLQALTSEPLHYNDLEDLYLPAWHKGRVVLIGDAAHGMTPNITQGASLAIEDAYVLSETLSGGATVAEDLTAFYLRRKGRVNAIQKRSGILGGIGQVKSAAGCAFRNFCIRQIPDKWVQRDLRELLLFEFP